MSAYAKLIIGIPLEKLYTRTSTKTVVTKYNQDTCKPIKRTIEEYTIDCFGIIHNEYRPNGATKLKISKYLHEKHKIHWRIYEEIIGSEISTGYEHSPTSISMNQLQKAMMNFSAEIQTLGLTDIEPQFHLLLRTEYDD
jgi:hypothetical protein